MLSIDFAHSSRQWMKAIIMLYYVFSVQNIKLMLVKKFGNDDSCRNFSDHTQTGLSMNMKHLDTFLYGATARSGSEPCLHLKRIRLQHVKRPIKRKWAEEAICRHDIC